jgi:large subunit ribosomal protein L29
MKASELREMGIEELQRRVAELRDESFRLRLRRATEQIPNPLRLRALRRDIARCMTVLGSKVPAPRPVEKANGQD